MSKKHYILVIDDNIDHLFILKKILESNGFNVDTVSTYEEVISHIRSFKYDIILLDIVLKDKNGIELLNELREDFKNITVIVMSAFGEEKEIVKAIKDGAIDYISKSIGFEKRILDSVQKNIEHKELKSEIKSIQKQYELLFEVANDFMFTLDLNGNFTRFNSKFKDFFGPNYSDFLMGKCFFNLITDEHKNEVINAFNSILFESVEPELIKIPLSNEFGKTIDFEINSTVLKNNDKINGVLCVARDVTQTNRLIEKEKELEFRLLEKHQLALIGKMIQGIAHNINTPLATIIGLSELLLYKSPDSKELNTIHQQGYAISEIIKNMSRKVQNEESESIELWDINYIIQEEIKFFTSNNMFKHQIEKQLNLQNNLPRVNIRYQHFSQAFDAILENAIEAMKHSDVKTLTVNTSNKNDHIIVEIEDTGIGFKIEEKDNLFSPFFTTKNSNSSEENLGLGLYNAYLLLQPYGIKLDATSNGGKTTFTIDIPINE